VPGVLDRLPAQILAVQMEQVESEVAEAVRLVGNGTVQGVEVRDAAFVLNHQFAIDDR
jgi:phosphoserine aminotransferase